MLRLAARGGDVIVEELGAVLGGHFDGRAVIVKPVDGDQLCERRDSADVVGMIMGDYQGVKLRESRGFHGCDDAVGIAVAGEAGVHKQRLARGSDDQRGRAALDVDPVDPQVARPRLQKRCGSEHHRQSCRQGYCQKREPLYASHSAVILSQQYPAATGN